MLARNIVASTAELLRRVEENDDVVATDEEAAEGDPRDVYDDWSFY